MNRKFESTLILRRIFDQRIDQNPSHGFALMTSIDAREITWRMPMGLSKHFFNGLGKNFQNSGREKEDRPEK
jgi:hypothetical protein